MRRFFTLLVQTLPLLVALALYGYVLRLPFFADDIPNFWILDHTNGIDIWGGSLAYQYYRPMTFTLWKLQYWLAGGYDAVLFHWVQLAFFGLTGVLVGLVTRRLLGSKTQGLLAGVLSGVLYVAFPFSYNVLGFVGALFHTTLVFFFLLALWAALNYWDNKANGRWLLVVCWLSALAGIFSHENGLLLIPLLLGIWLVAFWGQWRRVLQTRMSLRRLLLVLGPVIVVGILFLALWMFLPRGDFGDDLRPNAGLVERAALLLQGLSYPVSALGRLVIGQDAFLPFGAGLLLLLLPPLLLLALIGWRTPRPGLVAAGGWLWYMLSLVPAVLFLETGYVAIAGARLIMLASVGSSIFFGVSGAALIGSPLSNAGRWRGWFWRGLGVSLVTVLLVVGVGTVERFRAGYEQLGSYTDRFLAEGQALSIEDEAVDMLLVNAPDYVDIKPLTYLYGIERVVFMTPGLQYSHLYALNLGAERPDITSVAYSPTVLAAGYGAHEPHVGADDLRDSVREASHIMVTRFAGDEFWPEIVGGTALPALPGEPVAAYPALDYTLTGAAAHYQPATGTITAQIDWQAGGPAAVKQFLHVYCDGEFIAQADGYPLGDLYPFAGWAAGEQRSSLHTILLPQVRSLDCLQVYVGLYREDDGARLAAVSPATGEAFSAAGVPVPLMADGRGAAAFFNP